MDFIDGGVLVALAIGLVGGAFGGLLGIGGGTLFVPALVLILGTEQHVAQGVSLAVIVPTAISATQANIRAGFVDTTVAKWVTPPAVLLAFGGAFVAGLLDGPTLSRIFGVVVIYVGALTLITTARTVRRERAEASAEASR
ncbi:MAG: sulfite exporter TauE/SafE family protein [Dehalococcoidia bacterium]